MTETRPQLESGATITSDQVSSVPNKVPPVNVENTSVESTGNTIPSLTITSEVDTAAWQNNKRINGLWSINQVRNSWVSVDGIGWKKLVNNSDSAIVALTMLSSHAREKGSVVNYLETKVTA